MINEKITKILDKEKARQEDTIELIASENFASQEVMDLCGSVFTNKYAEGYPGKRYYNGCGPSDEIEQLAITQICKLFNSKYANVQPHSGANANTAVFQALLKPGDKILGMDLASGGHLSHGSAVNISGKMYDAFSYGVTDEGYIDYDEIERTARTTKPQLIIAGASAYPRIIDWARFREIADSVGAYLLADCSHYAGLIVGDAYPSPIPYADVTTTTTHKTLRGPRGGAILWNNSEFSRRINSAVFPGTQGGPLMHIIAAKAQCFIEAQDPGFSVYAHQVAENAMTMCSILESYGVKTLTQGTDSHIILVDLRDENITGRELADKLETMGITVNKNGVPNDPRSFAETSGIRIGTAAETTRQRSSAWFQDLARKIAEVIKQ